MITCNYCSLLASHACDVVLQDAPERSWEEEKKDLEQQLNARQGQTVRTDFSSHVFSKESEKCDFVDKATHSPRVVDYRFVADPSFIGPKPALQVALINWRLKFST